VSRALKEEISGNNSNNNNNNNNTTTYKALNMSHAKTKVKHGRQMAS